MTDHSQVRVIRASDTAGDLLPMERTSRAGGPALLGLAVLVLGIGVWWLS